MNSGMGRRDHRDVKRIILRLLDAVLAALLIRVSKEQDNRIITDQL
jgi:hypothetical protein